MRMLLQQAGTGLYLKNRGSWTDDIREALVLESWLNAYDFVVFNRLRDTFIVPHLDENGNMISSTTREEAALTELDFK